MSDRTAGRGVERRPGRPEPDPWLSSALRALDPAAEDPSFWFRFRARVLAAAAPELARRRMFPDATVGDVLAAWARPLVPAVLLAAAVAALLLARGPVVPSPGSIGVEELLVDGLGDDPIPRALAPEEEGSAVAFLSDRF